MESFIINTMVVLFIGKFWEDRVATWDLEGDIELEYSAASPAGKMCDYLTYKYSYPPRSFILA